MYFPPLPPFPSSQVIDYFGFLDDAIDEQDSDTMSLSLECFLNSLQEYCSCVWPMFFLNFFIAQMKVLGQFKKTLSFTFE